MYVTPEYQRTVYTALKKYFPATKEADLHAEYAMNLFPEVTDPSTIIRQLIAPALKKLGDHHSHLTQETAAKQKKDTENTVRDFLYEFLSIYNNSREHELFGDYANTIQTQKRYMEDTKILQKALTSTANTYSKEYIDAIGTTLSNVLHQIPYATPTAAENQQKDRQHYLMPRIHTLNEVLHLITGLLNKAANLPNN